MLLGHGQVAKFEDELEAGGGGRVSRGEQKTADGEAADSLNAFTWTGISVTDAAAPAATAAALVDVSMSGDVPVALQILDKSPTEKSPTKRSNKKKHRHERARRRVMRVARHARLSITGAVCAQDAANRAARRRR
jgi:hypothetical protein